MDLEELNALSEDKQLSIDYETYFGEMDLTEEQKKQRISLAKRLEDDMLFFFALISVLKQYEYDNMQFAIDSLENRYRATLGAYMDIDDYLSDYIKEFAGYTADVTQRHADEEWYLSQDRATLIAENEANTDWNYSEYQQAIANGMTQKTWLTMQDRRVRHTHMKVDGKTIPIQSVFLVGDSEFLFPKDQTFSPSTNEVAGCRCTITYL